MISAEDIQREDVVREALSWIGTPFHHAGRVKGAGVDCGQLPLAVFEACGLIPSYVPAHYPRDFHMHGDEEMYLGHLERFAARVREPRPGDMAMFRIGRVVSHGAIVVNWPVIVHAYVKARSVVIDDAVANQELARRFAGIWSFWAHPERRSE